MQTTSEAPPTFTAGQAVEYLRWYPRGSIWFPAVVLGVTPQGARIRATFNGGFVRSLTVRRTSLRPVLCEYCGQPKQGGTVCHGDDVCNCGPDGGKAMCCAGWGRFCCRCGASYARGQM